MSMVPPRDGANVMRRNRVTLDVGSFKDDEAPSIWQPASGGNRYSSGFTQGALYRSLADSPPKFLGS